MDVSAKARLLQTDLNSSRASTMRFVLLASSEVLIVLTEAGDEDDSV